MFRWKTELSKTGNYLSSVFLSENSLKQGDAFSQLLSFALDYGIMKIQEIKLGPGYDWRP